MKRLGLMAIFVIVPLVSVWGTGTARADQVVSDAAHLCLQGPQLDYYAVVNPPGDSTPAGPTGGSTLASSTGGGFQIDFRGLTYGEDDRGTFVIAQSHGDCVSFVAANDKKGSKDAPTPYLKIILTEVLITST